MTCPNADLDDVVYAETKFDLLKAFITAYLSEATTQVQDVREYDRNLVTASVLALSEHLVDFGFYSSSTDLRRLLAPLFRVLDGSTDVRSADQPSTEGLSRDAGPGAPLILDAKTRIMRILSRVWDLLSQCVVQSTLTRFRQLRDDTSLLELATAPGEPRAEAALVRVASRRRVFTRRKLGAAVAPEQTRATRAEDVVARQFLRLFTDDAVFSECDVVSLCGCDNADLDRVLLFLAHHDDDDLLRSILVFMRKLRCPRAWLLGVVGDSTLVSVTEAAKVNAYLRRGDLNIALIDTLPRLASMAGEFVELAARSAQWLVATGSPDGARVFAVRGGAGNGGLLRAFDAGLSRSYASKEASVLRDPEER